MKESNDITEYHKLNEDKKIKIQMGSYMTDTDKLLSHKISENISGKIQAEIQFDFLPIIFFVVLHQLTQIKMIIKMLV